MKCSLVSLEAPQVQDSVQLSPRLNLSCWRSLQAIRKRDIIILIGLEPRLKYELERACLNGSYLSRAAINRFLFSIRFMLKGRAFQSRQVAGTKEL